MASVIRVKRRIDDDPAEALFLSCKRRRETDVLEVKSVLAFAGTISSKDEPISKHIKEAIRQKKMRKELHPHSARFKHSHHSPEITNKLRQETEQTSRTNRFRITCSRRALDLDFLDKDNEEINASSGDSSQQSELQKEIECAKDVNDKSPARKKLTSVENTESKLASSSSTCSDHSASDSCKELSPDSEHAQQDSVKTTEADSNLCGHNETQSGMETDKMFCIFDVENDAEGEVQKELSQQSASGITLNNVPMQSMRVATPSPNKYVYDLYYTHSNLSDIDPEAVLTVQALCDELVYDQEDDFSERDAVYDDEEDSNDENNWRADYPDEDPRFFENADEDYDYAEDMVDTNFLHHDDDGDLLAYWMNTRCTVDAGSDDGENEYEGEDGDSSESSDE